MPRRAAAKSPGALLLLSLAYGAARLTAWIAAETCAASRTALTLSCHVAVMQLL